jgi:hypothetical protein
MLQYIYLSIAVSLSRSLAFRSDLCSGSAIPVIDVLSIRRDYNYIENIIC